VIETIEHLNLKLHSDEGGGWPWQTGEHKQTFIMHAILHNLFTHVITHLFANKIIKISNFNRSNGWLRIDFFPFFIQYIHHRFKLLHYTFISVYIL
jgi:hypothetical protein